MMETNSDKVIVNFTPTGMIPTKEMTPHVPISPDEIIDDVLKANELGITMVHLHARDLKTGVPTWEPEVYATILEGIRRHAPTLILGVSLSGRDFPELEKRQAVLSLDGNAKPDLGSLTLSSLNFNKQASMNEPEVIKGLAKRMLVRGVKPELEAFDAGMINYGHYLIRSGLLKPPYYLNLILGNIACAQADPLYAGLMIRDSPENTLWSIGGIGNAQLPMNSMSISLGGGVRVGLEDNIWFDKGRTRLATNLDLIERVHVIAAANERPIMSSEELRSRLDLQAGNGKYGVLPTASD